jgi:hypothetical protein
MFPVDVVYTWVDGSDEEWQRARRDALRSSDSSRFTERADDDSRYADHDELRCSLRSLEQVPPWIRHVWIVTADQRPSWLLPDHPRVSVVTHREIGPDSAGLPTFNSHAIEANLHRVSGLSEHFLYFNDDTFLGRPIRPDLFFHPNGIGKMFPSRALVDFQQSMPGDIASSTAAKNARQLLSGRFGATLTRKFYHVPFALTVSGLHALEAELPEAIAGTRRAQFRTVNDVVAAGSLYLNYGYLTGRLVTGRMRYAYVSPTAAGAADALVRLGRGREGDVFCINDGTSEQTPEDRRRVDRLIRSFLQDYLPVPGTFEQ